VLVHTPGDEIRKVLALGGDDSILGVDLVEGHAQEQHRRFIELLRADGAEVLEFTDLLESAIAEARDAGAWLPWLGRVAPQLEPHHRRLDARALIGADDAFVYARGDHEDSFRPLVTPLKNLFFTRDLAVMTPRGIVLSHFVNQYRSFETSLTAFAFRWAPALDRYPIAFDARAAGLYLQGGDVIVADERTLIVGVNNLTQEAVAPRLARALKMDVVAVELLGEGVRPGERSVGDPWNGLRTCFLHLDSVINLLAPRMALSAPYFLEMAHVGADPLTEVLRGLLDRPDVPRDYLERSIRALARIGLVRLYRAGSGRQDADVRGLKLVDYLRDRGYTIHYVGGPPPEEGDVKHLVECVHRELRFQAANVLALGPGRVLAADGNEQTEAALQAAGIHVSTFPADALVRWHGGPRCMSMPLERTPS